MKKYLVALVVSILMFTSLVIAADYPAPFSKGAEIVIANGTPVEDSEILGLREVTYLGANGCKYTIRYLPSHGVFLWWLFNNKQMAVGIGAFNLRDKLAYAKMAYDNSTIYVSSIDKEAAIQAAFNYFRNLVRETSYGDGYRE